MNENLIREMRNLRRKIEAVKRTKCRILNIRTQMWKSKNALDDIDSQIIMTKERQRGFHERSLEIIQGEQREKNLMNRESETLR